MSWQKAAGSQGDTALNAIKRYVGGRACYHQFPRITPLKLSEKANLVGRCLTLVVMTTSKYSTDLSDAEWDYLEAHLPARNKRGRPRIHSPREILDAVFYVLRSGCPWRLLPRDFPPWKTIFHYFRAWRINGTWERLHRAIRRRLRKHLRRDPQPSAGIVDTQSAKTTWVG